MRPKAEREAKQKICPVMSGMSQDLKSLGNLSVGEPTFQPVLCQGSACNWWQPTTDRDDMGVCLQVAHETSKG